jgi:hypothetical protein
MTVLRLHHEHEAPSAATPAVSRELARLDPFSFFVLSGGPFGVERVVVGITGTFVIHVTSHTVDGSLRRDLAVVRRAAKRARRHAGPTLLHTSIHPVLCVQGRQFRPFVRRGVRVIPWSSVVREVSARTKATSQHQAQRVAEQLGSPAFRGATASA